MRYRAIMMDAMVRGYASRVTRSRLGVWGPQFKLQPMGDEEAKNHGDAGAAPDGPRVYTRLPFYFTVAGNPYDDATRMKLPPAVFPETGPWPAAVPSVFREPWLADLQTVVHVGDLQADRVEIRALYREDGTVTELDMQLVAKALKVIRTWTAAERERRLMAKDFYERRVHVFWTPPPAPGAAEPWLCVTARVGFYDGYEFHEPRLCYLNLSVDTYGTDMNAAGWSVRGTHWQSLWSDEYDGPDVKTYRLVYPFTVSMLP